MTLAALTESDSLSSSRQTSHLKLLPIPGSGIFRNVLEVSDLLYADKLGHCNSVAGIAGNMTAEHRKTH